MCHQRVGIWLILVGIPVCAADVSAAPPPRERPTVAERPAPTSPALLLRAHEPETLGRSADGGILIREICRQAILIAARDELGLHTRDAALRESVGLESIRARPVDVSTLALKGKFVRIRLRQGDGDATSALADVEVPLTDRNYFDYLELVDKVEPLCRDTLGGALKRAGFRGTMPAAKASAPLPDGVESRLRQMNFVVQFAAVRAVHAAIRADGESPERLAALVRGYANLGQLTQFYWNATHKVFKARALLYANRMLARQPGSAWALWHRAYARALVGLHAAALSDLDTARNAAAGTQDRPHPEWLPFVEAYCRYETERLSALAAEHKTYRALGTLLRFLTLEHGGTVAQRYEAATDVVTETPDCIRVRDALCDLKEIGILHDATTAGMTALADGLTDRLRDIPECPDRVLALLPQGPGAPKRKSGLAKLLRAWIGADRRAGGEGLDGQTIVAVAEALVAAGAPDKDRGEPSWSTLGRMIQEVLFTQTVRRGWFMQYTWNVPVDDFLQTHLPLVAGHPYRKFVETLRYYWRSQQELTARKLADTYIVDADHEMERFFLATWTVKTEGTLAGVKAWRKALLHSDGIARDIEKAIVSYRLWPKDLRPDRSRYARDLLRVSPHAPLAAATLIEFDWKFAKDHVATWKKQFGDRAAVVAALARQYSSQKEYKKAEPYLEWCIEHAPEKWAYTTLAEHYLAQKNEEKWLETLTAFLEQEDYGLGHARVRTQIADHLMDKGEWPAALPYAEAAAQSGAGWAMLCAARCQEGLENWTAAEEWVRREAHRYEESQTDWHIWCARTGHGDHRAARQFAADRLPFLRRRGTRYDLARIGIFHLLDDDNKQALEAFQKAFGKEKAPYDGMYVATLADRLGKAALRDATLKTVVETAGQHVHPEGRVLPEYAELAALCQRCVADGEQVRDVDRTIDRLVESVGDSMGTNFHYFIGCWLERHGRAKDGRRYLEKAATSAATKRWTRTLAIDALRRRGVDVRQLKRETKPD